MAKRKTKWGERTYKRFLKEGKGQGDLSLYKPWLTTHDFPSLGTVTRVMGRVTNRVHHLLSKLEFQCFLYLESLPGIEDIKEQYPLPLEHTQLIASRLGINHPYVNGYPYVMTTDFYFKQFNVWHAIQVKPSSVLNDSRVQEKLKIEKAYFDKIGVEWRLMTEKELNKDLADNLLWLNAGASLEQLIPNQRLQQELEEAFIELYSDMTIPFHTILKEIDHVFNFSIGTGMQLFKSLIKSRKITLDLTRKINLQDPRVLPYLKV